MTVNNMILKSSYDRGEGRAGILNAQRSHFRIGYNRRGREF